MLEWMFFFFICEKREKAFETKGSIQIDTRHQIYLNIFMNFIRFFEEKKCFCVLLFSYLNRKLGNKTNNNNEYVWKCCTMYIIRHSTPTFESRIFFGVWYVWCFTILTLPIKNTKWITFLLFSSSMWFLFIEYIDRKMCTKYGFSHEICAEKHFFYFFRLYLALFLFLAMQFIDLTKMTHAKFECSIFFIPTYSQ